jgi:hypothetical protein
MPRKDEAELIADLRRQIAALIGRGEIPYVVEVGWKPYGILYRAHRRQPDDRRPRAVLRLPLRLIDDVDQAQVLAYRSERRISK